MGVLKVYVTKYIGSSQRADKIKKMMILRPRYDILEANGKITYHEASRAWSTIRLTKNIIEKFPDLKDQERRVFFNLKFYNSYQLLSEAIKELEKKKEGLPMLLFLVQE